MSISGHKEYVLRRNRRRTVVISLIRAMGQLLKGRGTFTKGHVDDIICNCGSQRIAANVVSKRVSTQGQAPSNF